MNGKLQAFYGQLGEKAPEIYYSRNTKEFLIKQTNNPVTQDWISVGRTDAVRQMRVRGIRCVKAKGEEVSPAEAMLDTVQNDTTLSVDYCGELGGYPKGFHRVGSFNALITKGPVIPRAVKGDWGLIRSTIDQLFGPQAIYIYSYMSLSRRQLVAMLMRGMPVIVMAGPKDCGKSFFQSHIMTPFLGGRGANISANITGKETFNGIMRQNEHLIMGDHPLSPASKDRRALGSMIKEHVATEEQTLRDLYASPIPVRTFSRMTISINDQPEYIAGLPMLDDSIEDKIMLFRTHKVVWPIEATTPEQLDAFEKAVESQIPAFCWWLDNEFHIPEELTRKPDGTPARFCLRTYHDPFIIRALTEVSPEFSLLEMVRQCYFMRPVPGTSAPAPCSPDESVCMTAMELAQGLKGDDSPVRREAWDLLSSGGRIATLLERLHSKFPETVFMKRTSKSRIWTIKDIDSMLGSDLI